MSTIGTLKLIIQVNSISLYQQIF